MTTTGKLYVVSGPSGAGKGTVIAAVMGRLNRLVKSVSATTRSPREGEQEGREYYFLSIPEFEEDISNGRFLEWARVYDNLYGTPRRPVEENLAGGLDVVLEIDIQGARSVKRSQFEAEFVFIAPPSLETLRQRLTSRGTEPKREIDKRMTEARAELESQPIFNHVVVNDEVDRAAIELSDIISKNRGETG